MNPKRTLAIRRGALGDSILFLPVLAAARRSFPAAEITFAGTTEVAELFVAHGVADRAIDVETLALWRLDAREGLRSAALRELSAWDWILGEVPPLLEGPAVTPIDTIVPPTATVAASEVLLASARRAWPVRWREPSPIPSLPVLRNATKGRLLVHPGSGSPRKNWSGFAALIERAAAAGKSVTLALGDADRDIGARLDPVLPDGVTILGRPSLAVLARALADASAFVGNDSGPGHLAAAIGVPTFVMFGPTPPSVWAPRGSHVRALPFDLGAEAVWRELLPCLG